MVHALKEIWRGLCVDGVLIDLRPISGTSRVEVVAGNRFEFAGLVEESLYIPNDLAANDAITQILQAGWFIREEDALFDYATYWNSPDEMSVYVQEKWSNSFLPEAVLAGVVGFWRMKWGENSAPLCRIRRAET